MSVGTGSPVRGPSGLGPGVKLLHGSTCYNFPPFLGVLLFYMGPCLSTVCWLRCGHTDNVSVCSHVKDNCYQRFHTLPSNLVCKIQGNSSTGTHLSRDADLSVDRERKEAALSATLALRPEVRGDNYQPCPSIEEGQFTLILSCPTHAGHVILVTTL